MFGESEACCNLLAPVYGWFTEGFDTRDLKEAKALLDELAKPRGLAEQTRQLGEVDGDAPTSSR
jgi:predicted ATPase